MAASPALQPTTRDVPPPLFHFEIDKITQPLLRSWPWIVGIIGSCIALALLAFLLTKPRYLAEATVRIEASAQRVVLTEEKTPEETGRDAERSLETTLAMARSASVREAVMRELQLANDGKFLEAMRRSVPSDGDKDEVRRDVLEALRDGMSANLVGNTRIAAIGFSSPDPDLSARLANSFARNLVRLDLQQRSGQSDFARSFLQGELDKLRTDLRAAESDANAYARGAEIISLTPRDPGVARSATLTSEALAKVNEQLSMATAKRIETQSQWGAIANRDPMSIPQVVSNVAIQQVVSQLTTVRAERDAARARHGDLHPEVASLTAKQRELESSLGRLAEGIKRGLRTSYESALNEERQLKSQLAQLRGEQLAEQDRSVNLSIMQGETATKRDQYDSLLARYNEVTAQAGAQVSNLSLLDPATPPEDPYWPRLSVLLAAAMAFGTILAAAFVIARELFFGRIRQPEDLSQRTGLPVIGAIPAASDDEEMHRSLGERHSPVQEGYAEALASLLLASQKGLPNPLMVSSSASGDGKSTSVFLLAQAIGATGRRVLVIDADMRRPTQHRLFETDNHEGLSTLLTSESPLASVVKPSEFDNVSLVTSGPIPPQPAELLSRSRFAELIAEAQGSYDSVLVDAPPVVGFADPLLLGGVVRNMVLIARADRTRPAVLRAAVEKLTGAGGHVVGAILTFHRRSARSSYDYYTYYRTHEGAEQA